MTRLKKELYARNILFEADEFDCMRGAEYDQARYLVAITDKYIITRYESMVLPSELHIFDKRTLLQIAGQNLLPDDQTFGGYHNRWESFVLDSEEQEGSRHGIYL